MGQGLELWINSTEVWCLTPEIHLITLLKKNHDWAPPPPKYQHSNLFIYAPAILHQCFVIHILINRYKSVNRTVATICVLNFWW